MHDTISVRVYDKLTHLLLGDGSTNHYIYKSVIMKILNFASLSEYIKIMFFFFIRQRRHAILLSANKSS